MWWSHDDHMMSHDVWFHVLITWFHMILTAYLLRVQLLSIQHQLRGFPKAFGAEKLINSLQRPSRQWNKVFSKLLTQPCVNVSDSRERVTPNAVWFMAWQHFKICTTGKACNSWIGHKFCEKVTSILHTQIYSDQTKTFLVQRQPSHQRLYTQQFIKKYLAPIWEHTFSKNLQLQKWSKNWGNNIKII